MGTREKAACPRLARRFMALLGKRIDSQHPGHRSSASDAGTDNRFLPRELACARPSETVHMAHSMGRSEKQFSGNGRHLHSSAIVSSND